MRILRGQGIRIWNYANLSPFHDLNASYQPIKQNYILQLKKLFSIIRYKTGIILITEKCVEKLKN